jgi:alpha-tubulin suppressor-like RCC1 family protein
MHPHRPAAPAGSRRHPRGRAGALVAAALVLATTLSGSASHAGFVDAGTVRTTAGAVDAVPLLLPGGLRAGDGYSLGWDADGVLYAWGENRYGQLGTGTGTTTALARPTRVALPDGQRVVDAAAGSGLTIALTADGGVWTWGDPAVRSNGPTPQREPFFDALDDPVVGIDAGGPFYLAWTSTGALYSWGTPSSYLGHVATSGQDPPARVVAQGLGDRAVSSASAGRHQAAAVVDGDVVVWGVGFNGYTGWPISGLAPGRTASVSVGYAVVLVLSLDGTVATTTRATAVPVAGLVDVVGAVASVPDASASAFWAWDGSGAVWGWGRDANGNLGLGTPGATHADPVPVPLPAGVEVTGVAAGSTHALHGTAAGVWAAAGWNGMGQHGCDTWTSSHVVVPVEPSDRWP